MRLSLWLVLVHLMFWQLGCAKNNAPDSESNLRDLALTASSVSCKTFVARLRNDFSKTPGSFFDFLEVPEDPSHPEGRKIKVFYYGRLVAGKTPVVFLNGGPAANSHGAYVTLTRRQKSMALWSDIPFVFFDQRGTGCSDPYPQGSDSKTLQRLFHYGSRGIVFDAERIRGRLGVHRWKVFGQSFGAFAVHRYAVLAPDSIVSAHAHAGIITSDPMQRLLGRIRSQGRVLDQYFAKFPEDREPLRVVTQKLTPDVCFSHSGFSNRVCGLKALQPLFANIGFPVDWPTLHTRLKSWLENGELNRTRVQELLDRVVFVPAEKGRGSEVARLVIDWADRNVASINFSNCTNIYASLRTEGFHPEEWGYTECAARLQLGPGGEVLSERIHQTIAQDMLKLSDFKLSLAQHLNMPFFLYSGALDAYVPVDDFAEELSLVGNLLRYFHFPLSGHDGYFTEDRVWDDLLTDTH